MQQISRIGQLLRFLLFTIAMCTTGCSIETVQKDTAPNQEQEPSEDGVSQPTGNTAFDSSSLPEDVKLPAALVAADAFIQWLPDGIVLFDAEAAALVMSEEDVADVQELVTITNAFSGGFSMPPPILRPEAFDANTGYLNDLVTAAGGNGVLGATVIALTDSCYTWTSKWQSYASDASARSYLIGRGFRLTKTPIAWPCTSFGSGVYGQNGNDYTYPVNRFGSGDYRYQAKGAVKSGIYYYDDYQGIISGSTVTFGREPNPEICEYAAPYWWWAYVYYFHRVYC